MTCFFLANATAAQIAAFLEPLVWLMGAILLGKNLWDKFHPKASPKVPQPLEVKPASRSATHDDLTSLKSDVDDLRNLISEKLSRVHQRIDTVDKVAEKTLQLATSTDKTVSLLLQCSLNGSAPKSDKPL